MLTKLKEQPAKLDAPELQVLLRDNLLRSISKKLFNNLHSIRVLDLRTEINSLLKNVRDKISVSLTWTNIETLSQSIGKLVGMEELYLECCDRLTYLPSNLIHLTRL